MNRLLALALLAILVVEASVFVAPDREVVLLLAAVSAAAAVWLIRWELTRGSESEGDATVGRDPAESLRRWISRTETLIDRSETSRSDWDKHLRPMLARQFELAYGQRRSKDPNAYLATALMVFGPDLWLWMDPDNLSPNGIRESGPGRAVLDELLQRLEQV